MQNLSLPVVVIGGGPVGLAAAAHLIERGESPLVLEAGASVGASVREWGHVRMFSPWEFTADKAAVRLLEASGWQMPDKSALPTGHELIDRYLLPLAELPAMQDCIHLGTRVVAISRRNIDKMKDKIKGVQRDNAPFVLHVRYATGEETLIEARAVIDASGTWQQPNPMGANGLPVVGEAQHAAHIAYGIPDILGVQRERYANKRTVVVGSGHSAINALLELAELQQQASATTIVWAMRNTSLQRVYGGGESDALPARGQLGTRIQALVQSGSIEVRAPFAITRLAASGQRLLVWGETSLGVESMDVDEVIVATGARPNLEMVRELRLEIDSSLESGRTLAPMIDPNLHSCGTVPPHGEAELRHPEKDFYIIGMKSYGRAPTFLLATGYEQARSVVAALMGDWESARKVELELPETGVCSTDLDGNGACCGAPTQSSTFVSLLDLVSAR